MPYTHPSPGHPVLGFAHRGGPSGDHEANTLAAFQRSLSLGVDGLETDIGLTADGVPVLVHPHVVPWNRLQVSNFTRAELPIHVPSLHDLYEQCGTNFDLSLDMAAPAAAAAVVETAELFGALDRLWLTYWKLPVLEEWRRRWPDLRLVYPTIPLGRFPRLMERLEGIGVDAVNVHLRFCTPRLVAHAHRRGRLIFAWGIRADKQLKRVQAQRVDGVYCDDVPGMVAALSTAVLPDPGGRR
jgi:glycerophosphoryl diester phosphodiesterase